MLSFLTRFFKKTTPLIETDQNAGQKLLQIDLFQQIAAEEEGIFLENFPLFYQDRNISIDLLFFFPQYGIYFGEILLWDIESLKDAKIELSSNKSNLSSTTHFESTELAIRQKIENMHSFDSTPCTRFVWMNNLREDDYDNLDSSFHELLPKERLIFSNSTKESIHHKFKAMSVHQNMPYSLLQVMGSLQSHMLILPTKDHPHGEFLSQEQQSFLETNFTDTITSLFGEHNSGKSTLILRKVLLLLLKRSKEKIVLITPTILAGEILHTELIALLEYGALNVDLSSLNFYTPNPEENIEETEIFKLASIVLCDDAYLMEKQFIDRIVEHRGKRWILLSMHNTYTPISDSSFILHNNYQKNISYKKISSTADTLLMLLLMELRSLILSEPSEKIMIINTDGSKLKIYKESIDEYFLQNCCIIKKDFSLQYQNFDSLILTTPEFAYGLHVPHIFLILPDDEENYAFALSRASESTTIISLSNPIEVDTLMSTSYSQES